MRFLYETGLARSINVLCFLLCVFQQDVNSQEIRDSGESAPPKIVISSVQSGEQVSFRNLKFGLTRDDFRAITETVDFARNAIAIRGRFLSSAHRGRESKSLVIGCSSPGLLDAGGLTIGQGRFLTEREFRDAESVCVIDSATVREIFGKRDPIGANLKIDSQYLVVVGVLANERTPDSIPEIIVPLKTMKLRWGDLEILRNAGTFQTKWCELSEIWIPTLPTRSKVRQLESLLKSRHDDKNDFRISDQ